MSCVQRKKKKKKKFKDNKSKEIHTNKFDKLTSKKKPNGIILKKIFFLLLGTYNIYIIFIWILRGKYIKNNLKFN